MNRSDMTVLSANVLLPGTNRRTTVYRASEGCYFVDVDHRDGLENEYVAIYNCMPYENPSMSMMIVPMPYGEMR